jgi:hypothetical protein
VVGFGLNVGSTPHQPHRPLVPEAGRGNEFDLTYGRQEIRLTRSRTTLRLFDLPTYDHLEFVQDDGTILGLEVPRATLDEMRARHYPFKMMDIVDDPASRAWMERQQLRDLHMVGELTVETVLKPDD